MQTIRTMTVETLATDLKSAAPPTVIDVREPAEFTGDLGHVPGARLIPLGQLQARVAELAAEKGAAIAVICKSGRRSEMGAQILVAAGFANVQSVAGGTERWKALGNPIER